MGERAPVTRSSKLLWPSLLTDDYIYGTNKTMKTALNPNNILSEYLGS